VDYALPKESPFAPCDDVKCCISSKVVVLLSLEYLRRAFEPLRISASHCTIVDALDGKQTLTGMAFGIQFCRRKWHLSNRKDTQIDSQFSLIALALAIQDICSKWRLNGERPTARWGRLQTYGLLALVLQRAQSYTLGNATLRLRVW